QKRYVRRNDDGLIRRGDGKKIRKPLSLCFVDTIPAIAHLYRIEHNEQPSFMFESVIRITEKRAEQPGSIRSRWLSIMPETVMITDRKVPFQPRRLRYLFVTFV